MWEYQKSSRRGENKWLLGWSERWDSGGLLAEKKVGRQSSGLGPLKTEPGGKMRCRLTSTWPWASQPLWGQFHPLGNKEGSNLIPQCPCRCSYDLLILHCILWSPPPWGQCPAPGGAQEQISKIATALHLPPQINQRDPSYTLQFRVWLVPTPCQPIHTSQRTGHDKQRPVMKDLLCKALFILATHVVKILTCF